MFHSRALFRATLGYGWLPLRRASEKRLLAHGQGFPTLEYQLIGSSPILVSSFASPWVFPSYTLPGVGICP